MPKITAIEKQKDRDRVSIFVDGKYSFSLTLNQYVELGTLKKASDITKEDINRYKGLSDYGKKLENSISWALRRPHSQRELENYLYRKKIEGEEKDKIITYLIDKKYIDDEQFTSFWVESRMRAKKPSKRALSNELRLKGISDSNIKKALDEHSFNDEDMIKEIIEKKTKLTKYKDPEKLKSYLARQGFSYDIINRYLS